MALCSPSSVVTVIVATPALTGVTTPSATVATVGSLDDQDKFLFVALSGSTAAVNVEGSPPTASLRFEALSLTPDTFTTGVVTVIASVVAETPSTVAVIVASPSPTAVTRPLASTVRTLSLEEDQTTWLALSSGETFAFSC